MKHFYIFPVFLLTYILPAQAQSWLPNSCHPPIAKTDLDINNVRARIMNGGDMWWDLQSTPKYEIPKGSGKYSAFAGALWIGGIDNAGQLRIAAMSYRQSGMDFWPGPLDTVNASIDDSTCWKYDRIFKLTKAEVDEFTHRYTDPNYTIPQDILDWPGNGNTAKGQAHFLAPFYDRNGDGIYNPYEGDYPAYALNGQQQNCEHHLLGDQTLWWVFNDKGNTHSETGGTPMGLEIHAQAFAYATDDEINDMTFYQYKAINRSNATINQMWWGQWIDSDLGYYNDDYVGCDVQRGIGYAYNGDSIDGWNSSPLGPGMYGLHPPALGVDFLGGPLADANDGKDNDRDSIIDEPGERIMMSKFTYYNSDYTVMGNPYQAIHFYYYLQGRWMDGTPMTYGGNAYNSSGPACDFIFPGDSDPYGWGTGGQPQAPWSELIIGNPPADRRFLMSAGPFTMQPGAVKHVTVGVVWARDMNGDHLDGVQKMKEADDKAQLLFDNCFNFPCASPQAAITYDIHDRTVLFSAGDDGTSYLWEFGDGTTSTEKYPSHTYPYGTFNVCVTVSNSCDTVMVCEQIVIEKYEPKCGPMVQRIEGKGNGGMELELTDAIVNEILGSPDHRSLFPVYKEMKGPVEVTITDPLSLVEGNYEIRFTGVADSAQWKIYLVGSTDTIYSDSTIAAGNEQHIPQWGLSVRVKQVFSPGNAASVNNGYISSAMTFSDNNKRWLTGLKDVDYFVPDNWIRSGDVTDNTGTSSLSYFNDYTGTGTDPNEHYENVLGGTWAPYRLVSYTAWNYNLAPGAPAWKGNFMNLTTLADLASVDLVITPDVSKWSRCPVLEMCEDPWLAQGNARKFDARKAPSVDKNGNPDGTGTGMGWFPGYAIDLETGERLNIMFGEDSWLGGIENGRDMKWNPSPNKFTTLSYPLFGGKHYIYIMAAKPISNSVNNTGRYDEGATIHSILSAAPSDAVKREVFRNVMWVGIPLLNPGHSLLSSEVKIKLRVSKPYAKYRTDIIAPYEPLNDDNPLYRFEISKDHLACLPHEGEPVLYPNPFNVHATLEFSNPDGLPHTLTIYDSRGRLVRVDKNITGESIVIYRGLMEKGMYYYSLRPPRGKPMTGKFVIAP